MFTVEELYSIYLFTVGEYSFPRVVESHMKMYKTYGPIVHESLGDMHFVRLFDPQVRNDKITNIVTLKVTASLRSLSRKRVIRRS